MYYEHFGLAQPPFRITPNTDFFFTGGNRGAILDALIYAVSHGEGIVKVTGEVGSGKTMLCSMMQARLPAHVETVYLANPSVGPEEVLHAIAVELQLGLSREADRLTVMHALQDYLLDRYAEHRRVVVFIEESQSMPVATLEEIRLLSNLETRSEKLMQIVLFGQPELDEILRQSNIRQLRDRIAHSFRLEPLNAEEVREYLSFRMRTAGYKGPDVFSPAVVRQIARASSGLTRRINLIADKALLAAFAENTHAIKSRHIRAALRDSEFTERSAPRRPAAYAWPAAAMVAGLLVGASLYALATKVSTHSQTDKPPAAAPAPEFAAEPTPANPAAQTVPVEKNSGDAAKDEAPILLAGPSPSPDPAESAQTTGDWLAARSAATAEWLRHQPQRMYTIQLLGAGDEQLLKEHLNDLAKFIEMEKIFVYRVDAKGKPWVNVLYGSFADLAEAQRAVKSLPPALKTYKPVLRTVQGIRTELSRYTGS